MKMMNKVIAAAMMMAITFAMPAIAGNKKYGNNKKATVVVVTNDKKLSHFDKVDKRASHFDAHRHAYRPDVKACTFKAHERRHGDEVESPHSRTDCLLRCKSNISPSYHALHGITVCHTIYFQEVPACYLHVGTDYCYQDQMVVLELLLRC